jgi:hypothetical protein
MIEYVCVVSLSLLALGALENKFLKNFLNHSVYVDQFSSVLAFWTPPLTAALQNSLLRAIEAKDTRTLGALFRLEHHVATNPAQEVVNYCRQLSGHEISRAHLYLTRTCSLHLIWERRLLVDYIITNTKYGKLIKEFNNFYCLFLFFN